jgi:hypothetical protein
MQEETHLLESTEDGFDLHYEFHFSYLQLLDDNTFQQYDIANLMWANKLLFAQQLSHPSSDATNTKRS